MLIHVYIAFDDWYCFKYYERLPVICAEIKNLFLYKILAVILHTQMSRGVEKLRQCHHGIMMIARS